jgi:hypothetical protein
LGLTDDQIREIQALDGRATYKEVMARYKIATKTITRIWRGELAPSTDTPEASSLPGASAADLRRRLEHCQEGRQ